MDFAALEALTDDELMANALSDPDTLILTPERRAQFRPATEVRRVRHQVRLTQEEFATRFGIALGTLRDWEQGRRMPDATARTLLRIIARDPDLVASVVESSRTQKADAAD